MPASKRKAPTKASAPANKKVRIGDTSIIEESEETLPTRPRRKSVAKEAVAPVQDTPKRRGRPPKQATATTATSTDLDSAPPAQKARRGRPPGKTSSTKSTSKPTSQDVTEKPATKQRGRPRKSDAPSSAPSELIKGTDIRRGPGRPRRVLKPEPTAPPPPSNETLRQESALANESDTENPDEEHGEHQYWLMKAEPNDRFENGVNVKFSIDDLAAATEPEPWDGVRNYSARNNMRAMRKNDLAFFYHSNCASPGIVGIMRIVQEHSPDKSAFDPKHPYHDPKSSPDNPRWDCVHVEFVRKFAHPVTLKMMQVDKAAGGPLAGMQLLRLGRLSVSGVSAAEWRVILGMAGEEDVHVGEKEKGEEMAKGVERDGYESDTDGEVDGGPKEELNGDITAAATAQAGAADADVLSAKSE